ncbi:MAG: CBS domain-containing protein [Anaerolineales bacterium]|nr:CBS domain-containing protein [Anaerolineales bacterium]
MSLKSELSAERVSHLDLSGFCQAAGDTPVREVIARMRTGGHGVCLVMAAGRLAGIFTERDVLTRVVAAEGALERPISELMTRDPHVASPEMSAAAALALMDAAHFRNLPVVDQNGDVLGDMTYQSIINYLAARYATAVLNRPLDPEKFPRKPEGG